MRLFLGCIDEALSHKEGTSVDLVHDDQNGLYLKTTTPLPGSLAPLVWNFELKRESPSALSKELIVPLLSQRAIQNVESTSLLQQLKEKDHIIDKLIDTIQADGIALNKVFPGAQSSKFAVKSNPRQALSKNVKGLSEFDEKQWRMDLKEHTARRPGLKQLVSKVFGNEQAEDLGTVSSADYGEWWSRLSDNGSEREMEIDKPQSQMQDSMGASEFQVS